MKINNRFIYGIISILLAAVIALVAIPVVSRKTSGTIQIVRVKNPLERGQQITKDDIELVEVGSFNLPDNLALQLEDVNGTYAAASFAPGDYILPSKVKSSPLSSDPALNSIPDGMVAISVTTQTLATSLSDKLQAEDIVRLYHYDKETNPINPVSDIPELKYIKILSISDSKGVDVDYTKPPEGDNEKLQTATITVLATPEQAMLLTRYENEGVLHIALISRGNKKLAEELLQRQADILAELYPDDLDLAEAFDPAIESGYPPGNTPASNDETDSSTERQEGH